MKSRSPRSKQGSKAVSKTTASAGQASSRQELAQELLQCVRGSELSWKFGHASLTVSDKVFAFTTRRQSVVMKLPGERVEELLASSKAKRLAMGKRTMREWVELPDALAAGTLELLLEARDYVASLPETPARTRAPRPGRKRLSA